MKITNLVTAYNDRIKSKFSKFESPEVFAGFCIIHGKGSATFTERRDATLLETKAAKLVRQAYEELETSPNKDKAIVSVYNIIRDMIMVSDYNMRVEILGRIARSMHFQEAETKLYQLSDKGES